MKKILIMMVAVFALSCDSPKQSSEGGSDSELENSTPVDPAETDESNIHSDTTTSGGVNRQNQYDTLK